MKISLLQEIFSAGLNTANRLVAPKAQLPVLSNVLLATDQERLKLSSTNLETGINLWLGAKVEEAGSISIPAKILTEYVSSLSPGKIDLEIKDNCLVLKGTSFQASFIGLPASEFPSIPSLATKSKVTLKVKDLGMAISQVAFAASMDESRPQLTGVLLKAKDNQLMMVATDGYRLSIRNLEADRAISQEEEFQKGLLIPARTLMEVAKIINVEDEKGVLGMTITPESKQVIFSTPNCEIISRLIEGKLPDYEKIIPEKFTTKVFFDTESFQAAVRTAAIFARESANIIKLSFKEGKIGLMANAASIGDNLYEIEAKIEGEEGKIAFNSRYLLDFLNVVSSDLVEFRFTTSLNPGVFLPAGSSSFTHIIMPVRVQE